MNTLSLFRQRALLAALALALSASIFASNKLASKDLSPVATTAATSPSVEGALANGLRYTLLPHRRDLGRVSVRLVVLAGSLDERDDERGYAHFVEHMAFNGTRHYPPSQLVPVFQNLGVAFGPDLCATTSFTDTTYKLDLPAGRTARLGEALGVLRDFADGVAFAPAEVQREKGVVLSELGARNTEDWQVETQRLRALYGGTLLPGRFPTGEPGVIERATAESLRGFYRRVYHPARLRLTVVGDIDAAGAKKLIEQHFASLRGEGPAVAEVLAAAPPAAFQTHVIASASTPAASASLIVVAPRGDESRAGLTADLANDVVIAVLDRRLRERRARMQDQIGGAGASTEDGPESRFIHHEVWAQAAEDDWESAVGLIESEVRRARQGGLTAAELREVVTSFHANLRASSDQFAGEFPDAIAASIAAAHAARRNWPLPAMQLEIAGEFLSRFDEAGATAALRALFAEDRLRLILIQRTPAPGARNALLAAYRASAARPLDAAAVAPAAALQFRYGDFGPPGQVAQHRVEKNIGVELIRFANDTLLNLRPSTTEPNRFRLTARFGRGMPDLPRAQPGLPHLAAHFLGECDLGRHTREEITRLLGLRAVSAHGTLLDSQLAIEVEGPARELPFVLQLLTARIADVRLERSQLRSAVSGYGACRASALADGNGVALLESIVQMAGGDARCRAPSPNEISQYPFPEIAAWMRAHWLEGPLEIGVAGDFDPAVVVAAAAASIGTLPMRRTTPAAAPDPLVLREAGSHEVRRVPLADQTAAVRLSWAAPHFADLRRRAALGFACEVLEDRLQKILREDLGVTYSPTAGLGVEPRQRDFGYASVVLTFAPERADEFARRAVAIAAELARGGVTAEEFSRLREPLLANVTEDLRSNQWWLNAVLAHAQGEPAVLEDARTRATVYAELTRDEVSRVAAECFRPAAANTVIIIPIAPAGDTPDASSAIALHRRAITKVNRGDFAGAIADLTQVIALDPQNAEAYLHRGGAKVGQGDAVGGIADSSKALELDPKNASAYNNRAGGKLSIGDFDGTLADSTKAIELDPLLANAFSNRAAARLSKSDYDGCITDATKALELESKNAGAHVIRGFAQFSRGNFAGALTDATKAIELDPQDAKAYSLRGFAKLAAGNPAGALPDFDRAIEINPKLANVHRERGNIRQSRGNAAGALADFDHAIENNPADSMAHHNRGILRFGQRDLAGALADFDDAIRSDPQNADAYNSRGWAKQSKGDLDGAIADFSKAIELRPTFALPYTNRGNARRAKGDTFGAMADLDQGITLAALQLPAGPQALPPPVSLGTTPFGPARPTAPAQSPALALVRSGDAKRLKRDLPGALADYEKAIQQDPAAAEALVGRALVRAASNDPTGALADLDQAIALRPTLVSTYLERGNFLRNRRDYPRALADYTQAIELQPKSAPAYYGRGFVHETQHNYTAALADFDMAIAANPTYVPAYNGRGHAHQAQGDFDRAILDYNEAIKRSDNYSPAYFSRGQAHQVQGHFPAALADYDKLIALNPRYPNAHANRANVRHAQGDFAGALADYDQAMMLGDASASSTPLFRWLVQRRLQRDEAGAELARTIAGWPAGWMKSIGRHLAGELTEAEFFAGAADSAGRTTSVRVCESNYFAGMKHLLENDPVGARALFEKSVATNQPARFAHILAGAELARLGQPPALVPIKP